MNKKLIEFTEKILRSPEAIPCDKRIHALGGSFIGMVLMLFHIPILMSLIILVIIAWGIEYYQKFTKTGNFDHYDAVAVVIGGLIPIIPVILL